MEEEGTRAWEKREKRGRRGRGVRGGGEEISILIAMLSARSVPPFDELRTGAAPLV